MDLHRLAEERSIAYHRWIAERLAEDPSILDQARARVNGWLVDGSVHAYYAQAWARLLSLPLTTLQASVVDPGEEARALRQVTPFAGALDPRTRWRIWASVRERAGA